MTREEVQKLTEEVISELKADGVDLSEEYTVQHHIVAPSQPGADASAEELEGLGYFFDEDGPEEIRDGGVDGFCLDAMSDTLINVHDIMTEADEVMAVLKEHGAVYDGWGIPTDDGLDEADGADGE